MKLKRTVTLRLLALSLPSVLLAQVPPPPVPAAGEQPSILRVQPGISYGGSVAQGQANGTALALTLKDAIQRGLQYNLGVLTSRDIAEAAKVERRRALASLLPNVSAGLTQTSQQLDLVAFGFSLPGFPTVIGPFGYENARAYFEQTVYDRTARLNLKSLDESRKAADLSAGDARNLVVQAVSNAYLEVITQGSRIDAIQAEVNTAQALFDRASDQNKAGTVPGIDVLRAEVQLKAEQQRLLAQKNELEKAKLTLARTIGLPAGQAFSAADALPFSPVQPVLEDLLQRAYANRGDFRAAEADIRAAQLAVESAHAQHWPTVVVQGDYGIIGPTLANPRGTYSILAGVHLPIYAGGRTQTDVEEAEIVLRNRKNALEDLRGRIEYEIRNALLDLQSSAEQVSVAKTNVDLANETLTQAKDRFSAGVTDNIEAVQAQQLLAQANENYIGSLNAHNAAKIALATAVGVAEQGVPAYLGLK